MQFFAWLVGPMEMTDVEVDYKGEQQVRSLLSVGFSSESDPRLEKSSITERLSSSLSNASLIASLMVWSYHVIGRILSSNQGQCQYDLKAALEVV